MKVKWSEFGYEKFVSSLPFVVNLYLGDELNEREGKEDSEHGYDFYLKNERVLSVHHRLASIGPLQFEDLASTIARKTPSTAILIVSWRPSPFRIRLFQNGERCWIPAVSWGRRQVDAIASLNREKLDGTIPYFGYEPAEGSAHLGAGAALWSDIIGFRALGFQIGQRIGADPVEVRRVLMDDVDQCFHKAGASNATFSDRVGADGWYHFYRSSSAPLDLAVSTQIELENMIRSKSLYNPAELKIVMGAHTVDSCHISEGGPYDDDSMIAYLLTTSRFKMYNIRATKNIITTGVTRDNLTNWTKFDKLDYDSGSVFELYGHTRWP